MASSAPASAICSIPKPIPPPARPWLPDPQTFGSPLAGAVWTTAPTRGPSELRQRGCAQRSAAARSHCALAATRAEVGFARKALTDGARLDNQTTLYL